VGAASAMSEECSILRTKARASEICYILRTAEDRPAKVGKAHAFVLPKRHPCPLSVASWNENIEKHFDLGHLEK